MAEDPALQPVNPATGQAYSKGAPDVLGDIGSGLHWIQNQWDTHLGAQAVAKWQTDYPTRTSRGMAQAPGADLPQARGVVAPDAKPLTEEQKKQNVETSSEVVSQALNPLNWPIDPASALGVAGHIGEISQLAQFAGAPAAHAMLNGDVGALIWSGVTAGLMGMGHLTPEVREALQHAAPWMGDAVKTALKYNSLSKTMAENPYDKQIPDGLKNELEQANEELATMSEKRVAKEPLQPKKTKSGDLARKPTPKQEKARKAFFKKYNVKDEAGFVNYVKSIGGELPPQDADFLKKNYKNLLFNDPLFQTDPLPGQYINPAEHLDQITDKGQLGQAVKAASSFNALRWMSEAGTYSESDPATGMVRGILGHNHSVDLFDSQLADQVAELGKGMDGKKLLKILDAGADGEEDYNKLSPQEKYVTDMFRAYAHMAMVSKRKAGSKMGQIANYVPRIGIHLPLKTRGAGTGSSSVLQADFKKARQWKLSVMPKMLSVKPEQVAHIKKQLGALGDKLTTEELATVEAINGKLPQEDADAVMASLRKTPNPAAASKMIEGWAHAISDQSPDDNSLNLVQAFRTVDELNKHYAERRVSFTNALLSDPEEAAMMSKAEAGIDMKHLLNDPEIQRISEEQDVQAAKAVAMRIFTPREDDLFKILSSGHFARELKGAHSLDAMKQLKQTMVDLGDGRQGAAAVEMRQDPRENLFYTQQGYRTVENVSYEYARHLFAPEVAKFMNRATKLHDLGLIDRLGTLEQKAIGMIMYNPVFHGWNIAGRAMAFGMSHPLQAVNWIKSRGKLAQMSAVDRATAMNISRAEFFMNGGVTPHSARHIAGDMASGLANAFGDVSLHDLGVLREENQGRVGQAMRKIPGMSKVISFNEASQKLLWNHVSDFGVTVYHMEKEAAMARGVDEGNATRWAVRRANTWMGHVSDLDHNPAMHKISRLLMFAPNYWRTFGELMLPIYKDSGIEFTPQMTGYIVRQQVATMMSLLAVQKITGNVANFAFSGHSQFENQPGKQDRIEVSRPEIIQLLQAMNYPGADKIDPQTGEDPATGGKLYFDNPLSRQQEAAEQVAGMQSGYKDWQPSDAVHGSQKVLAARLSPLVDSIGALGNIDVYNSISTGTVRNVNPDHEAFQPDISNFAYALLGMTPLGLSTQNIAREFASQSTPNAPTGLTVGPYNTTVPKWVADTVKGAEGLPMNVITGATGVNAPYENSPRGRGTQVGDDVYRKLNQTDSEYQTHLKGLSQQAMSGQITPSQWHDQYVQLTTAHSAATEALMQGSPSYMQGTRGMVGQWEDLYNQATDPTTGSLDPDKLSQLQAQFTSQHSQAEMDAMNAELKKNKQQDPMYSLYQQAIQGYDDWRTQYAQQNGTSVQKLKSESNEYSNLYGDPVAAAEYLASHPELRRYQSARDNQFYHSPQGYLFGAFYPNSVSRAYLTSTRLSPLQMAQQEQAIARAGI